MADTFKWFVWASIIVCWEWGGGPHSKPKQNHNKWAHSSIVFRHTSLITNWKHTIQRLRPDLRQRTSWLLRFTGGKTGVIFKLRQRDSVDWLQMIPAIKNTPGWLPALIVRRIISQNKPFPTDIVLAACCSWTRGWRRESAVGDVTVTPDASIFHGEVVEGNNNSDTRWRHSSDS